MGILAMTHNFKLSPSILVVALLCLCSAAIDSQGICCDPVFTADPADINLDERVDAQDLAILLGAWGLETFATRADINQDLLVDAQDLAILLGRWTTQPLSWATVLEFSPCQDVITDSVLRAAISATGLPWRVRDNATGIEMLLVAPGTFMMGASPGDAQAWFDEMPAHQVTITHAFYLGKTEVTQAQWQSIMGNNPSAFVGFKDSPSRPVEQLSWNMVQPFCIQTGLRLPTEAEWEFACRASNTTPMYGPLNDIAWNVGNNPPYGTKAVATKLANALGFYDMIGNVWEWCQDRYGWYSSASVTDPQGPSSGSTRVIRGGSWGFGSSFCRASRRFSFTPNFVDEGGHGFRVARNCL